MTALRKARSHPGDSKAYAIWVHHLLLHAAGEEVLMVLMLMVVMCLWMAGLQRWE